MNYTGLEILILVVSVIVIIRAGKQLKYFITAIPNTECNELRTYLLQQERDFLLFVASQMVKRGEVSDPTDIQNSVYVRACTLPPHIDQILKTHSESDMLDIVNKSLIEEIDKVIAFRNAVKL